MTRSGTRRELIGTAAAAAFAHAVAGRGAARGVTLEEIRPASAEPIKVVVWDEQQPAQKQAYENFLGNAIADHLKAQPGLSVRSVKLDDPEQGLSAAVLDGCRVLIWWGHVRQAEVTPATGRSLVERIKDGGLSLIPGHETFPVFKQAEPLRVLTNAVRWLAAPGD